MLRCWRLAASGSVRGMRSVLDTSVPLGPNPGRIASEVPMSTALAGLHFGVLIARTDSVRATRLRRLATIEQTLEALNRRDRLRANMGDSLPRMWPWAVDSVLVRWTS